MNIEEDPSTVVVDKPDTHKREYSYLKLPNGFKALVGSDPNCDKAGAAVCVNVGMCHERKDLPGLAHFLEHMLFTGTTKYPKESEYSEFIKQNGGSSNAYTTCYFTNFHFDVKPDCLEDAMDRFSRFFTEPLLTRDCTDREINAVDSEFQGGLTSPWWRYVGIMDMSANPDHPFHVACGNNKVLKDEPTERGLDLYDEMKKLYETCYSANGMTLCVIGKQSIEELKAMVTSMFSGVVDRGVTMPIGDSHGGDQPPFLPEMWHQLLLQHPVKDIKKLTFSWVVPYLQPFWQSKPSSYLSHILGHEGAGTFIAVLKHKGLISACGVGGGAWLEGCFSLLKVDIDLTDKGLTQLKEIGTHVFGYIALLAKMPLERWIYDEMRNLGDIRFKFADDRRPGTLCPSMAHAMQRLPPSQVLAGDVKMFEFKPEHVADLLKKLTVDTVRVTHQAKCLEEKCTDKDKSYDSPMKFLPLDQEWIQDWTKVADPGDGGAQAALDSAAALGMAPLKANPFIPEDLSMKAVPEGGSPTLPAQLWSKPSGPVAALFHRQDDVFQQPKATAFCQIWCPFIMSSVDVYVRVELWCRCVEEALNEYAYDAEIAGMRYALRIAQGGLNLSLSGYNDKLDVLLAAVLHKMRSLTEVDANIYDIVADKYGDEIRNAAFHSPPHSQSSMRFTELFTRGTSYPSYLRAEAFKSVKREELSDMPSQLFASCRVEIIMLGNMLPSDLEALASTLTTKLQLQDGAPPAVQERAEAQFPEGQTLWRLEGTDEHDPNHAVYWRVQTKKTVENEIWLNLINKVLSAKYFDVLRTQQQLGYIVQMGSSASSCFAYLVALVQTEFPPDYVRSRIASFFKEHFEWIQNELTEEEFERCRQGLLTNLKMKPKNLSEEFSRYATGFMERTYEFDKHQKMIDATEGPCKTLESLKAFVAKLSGEPQLYTQVKKRLDKEDKPLPEGHSVPEEPACLRLWNGHLEVVTEEKSALTWASLSAR